MRVEHSVTIACPQTVVWAFLSDYKNDPLFIEAVTRVSVDGPMPPTTGSRMRRSMRLPIVNADVDTDVEIIRVDPGHAIAFRASSGPLSFVETREVEQNGAGTRVTFRLEGDPGGALKLGTRMMEWQAKRAMTADLSSLKRVLESRDPR
jgi:carbon monoxide dehydrogenase subunit G